MIVAMARLFNTYKDIYYSFIAFSMNTLIIIVWSWIYNILRLKLIYLYYLPHTNQWSPSWKTYRLPSGIVRVRSREKDWSLHLGGFPILYFITMTKNIVRILYLLVAEAKIQPWASSGWWCPQMGHSIWLFLILLYELQFAFYDRPPVWR